MIAFKTFIDRGPVVTGCIWEVQSQEDLIFSSGKLGVAGSKSEEEACENVRKVY